MNTITFLDLLSHTALKGAAVLLVALLLGLILHRMAAARRYALWITAVITLALLPLAMGLLPAWHVLPKASGEREWPVMEPPQFSVNAGPALPAESRAAPAPAPAPAATDDLPVQAPAPPAFSWNISWQDVVETLPLAWMLVAAGLLLRLAASAWRLHRLEVSLRPGECALLEPTARELALKRMPRLLIGPADSVPMVWGVFRPRLLLPQGFETWSPEKQRGVLLHELAHLKRGDPLALWLAQWVKALHWFNPLAWLTLRQLRADQERACDDAVLRQGVRPSDYAQSLLDLSRHNRLAPGLSLCALTITRCAPVEARVKAILDPRRRREGLTLRWLAGLAGGALLITLPVAMLNAIEGPQMRGRILDRNGVVLAESTKEKVRVYPLKTLAAHMIGYTRGPDEEHAQLYGGAGFEKQRNAVLAAGKDVALTLDMRIQSLAYRAMSEAGVTRGAAVVLDPRTGEILAAVSLPSHDPNLFVPSITQENWERYLQDRDVPLMNRAVKGYSPGASFFPLTALGGIAAGVGDRSFTCNGTVTYGSKVMQCWIQRQNEGRHGLLNLRDALVASCNCFWYQYGNAAGIEQIGSMGRVVGFGSAYGITEDESPGILPGPDWLKQHHPQESWSAGTTANTAIGQGYMLATPLQMAVLAATVGNGGKVPQPCIIQQTEAGIWREDLTQGRLTAADVVPLREGMRLVVNGASGTGRLARSDKVVIAGKTGTTQNWRIIDGKRVDDNNTWFIGFAPFDKPTLAFAILKQGGKSGGSDCAPITKRIVEEALALPADGSGEVKPVSDDVGRGDENLKPAQARFDAKADAFRTVIGRIAQGAGTGFQLDQFFVKDGQVMVSGSASGVAQALEFRDRVLAVPFEDPLEWTCPVPGILPDGKRAKFEMLGLLVWKGKNMTTQEAVKAARARMRDPRSNVWDAVRESAGLAEVPGGRVGFLDGSGETSVYFYLLRNEIADWLRKSLGENEDLRWLSSDAQKGKIYTVKNGCEIEITPKESSAVFKVKVKPSRKNTAAASATKSDVRQQADAEIRMKPALANQWAALKKAGLLADLPTEAHPFDSSESEEKHGKSGLQFRFDIPRAAGHQWLLASVYRSKNVEESSLQWPEPPEAFHRTYAAAGPCTISILSSDGEHLIIIVSQQKGSILIAPDETAPPAPKTSAPGELSGVVSNDTPPMEEDGKRKLEFDADEISRQIRLLASKTGVSLREFKNGGGKLSFIGLADAPDDARRFGDGLTQGGKQWGIAWKMTTPAKVPDRPVTMFMAVGVHPAASIRAAVSSPPSKGVSAAIGVVSPLSHWRTLQQFGKLADLPADHAPERVRPAGSLGGPMPSLAYAFTASRKAVHAWLTASLPSKRLEAHANKLRELSENESFQHEFWGQDGCRVQIVCAEGKARVLITRWTGILIAPDESQTPRPAGRLAPEYRQDGLTLAEPALPTLDANLRGMRSTVSPDEEKQVPWLV